MTNINGESFEVILDESTSTICFKGALRLSGTEDYASILSLLKATLETPGTAVMLDLRELEFLNSSGITMFARFVIEARDKPEFNLEFRALESSPWQGRSLRNLQKLMPALQIHLA
jgi:hypothetical protein